MTTNTNITTSGQLKLTDAEVKYLQQFLTANDRGGYYLALYNMTGVTQVLVQGEISTFSEAGGGAAYVSNMLMYKYEDQYKIKLGDYIKDEKNGYKDKLVTLDTFSNIVAQTDLNNMNYYRLDTDKDSNYVNHDSTGYFNNGLMLEKAFEAWKNVGIVDYFPAQSLTTAEQSVLYVKEVIEKINNKYEGVIPSMLEALKSAVQVYVNEFKDNKFNDRIFLDALTAKGTQYAVLGVLLGSRFLAKRLSDFEGREGFKIIDLPDAKYKVVINISNGFVAGMFRDEFVPDTMPSILTTVAEYWPEVVGLLTGGLSGLITANVFAEQLEQVGRLYKEIYMFQPGEYSGMPKKWVSLQSEISEEGTEKSETLWGKGGENNTAINDLINGGGGDDRIFSGDGNDRIYGDAGNDILYGQKGNDYISGGGNNDVLRGGEGNDELYGDEGDDYLDGGDITDAESGDDILVGGKGRDVLVGASGSDFLYGDMKSSESENDDGDDELYGGDGVDYLTGGGGNDYLDGGDGDDTYYFNGNFGNDVIRDNDGRIIIDGVLLAVGEQQNLNLWKSADGAYFLSLQADPESLTNEKKLVITKIGNAQNSITIKSWENGDFGFSLIETPITPPNNQIITGLGTIEDDYITNSNHYITTNNRIVTIEDGVAAVGKRFYVEGKKGNDIIQLDDKDYYIDVGGGTQNKVTTGNGNNIILSGLGSDQIFTGSGNDFIRMDSIVKTSFSEADIQHVASSGILNGAEALPFGFSYDANRKILADWSNYSSSGAGQDVVIGGYGFDTIYAGNDDDVLIGGGSGDLLNGEQGNDIIYGDGVVATTYANKSERFLTEDMALDIERAKSPYMIESGTLNNNYITTNFAYHGNDQIYGGTGNDIIFAEGGNDIVYGGDDDDVISGDSMRIINLYSVPNSQYQPYLAEVETLQASYIYQYSGNDRLYSGEGIDKVFGGYKDDKLYGGGGNDKIYGDSDIYNQFPLEIYNNFQQDQQYNIYNYAWNFNPLSTTFRTTFYDSYVDENKKPLWTANDYIEGGDGEDEIYGEEGSDTIYGGADNDIIQGDSANLNGKYHGDDLIYGDAGDDQIWGQGGNDIIYGGEGDDTISGDDRGLEIQYHGNDTIEGGAGNDSIWGDGGADVIYGGDGNDYIQGDSSNIDGQYHANDVIYGDAGNDNIFGDGGADQLYGGDGDDYIEGDSIDIPLQYHGNDELYGGKGNDVLLGFDGDDTLDGGADNDQLYGGNGNDKLISREGLEDSLFGGAGNDNYYIKVRTAEIKIGDHLGDDHIYFEGDLNLSKVNIVQYNNATELQVPVTDPNDPLSQFKLVFFDEKEIPALGGGLVEDEYGNPIRGGYNLYLHFDQPITTDGLGRYNTLENTITRTIHLDTYLKEKVGLSFVMDMGPWAGINGPVLVFSNGSKDINNNLVFNGSFLADQIDIITVRQNAENNNALQAKSYSLGQGDDIAQGSNENDNIRGDEGNDTLYGHLGDDTLYGGDNDDLLYGGDGNDYLDGGQGNDHLLGDSGNDELYGGNGDDVLEAGDGDDLLEGGMGNDLLKGGFGNDIYILGKNFGNDTIDDNEGINIIRLKDIQKEQITINFSKENEQNILISNEENTLLIKDFFNGNFSLEFDDGTIWNKNELANKIFIEQIGTPDNDQLNGHLYVSDYLQGLAGDDTLYGYAGNDILVGGEGNDRLVGGLGNDTYIFAPNFGHDIIHNVDYSENRQDAIQFTEGLKQTDFTYRRHDNDLIIKSLDGENSITVQNYFIDDGFGQYRIDQIKFSDNSALNVEAVKALVLVGTSEADLLKAYAFGSTISAEAGDDTLQGNIGNDQLYGGDGLDKLYGSLGDDLLDGGAGNDHLEGGEGDDILNGGAGNDTLQGDAGNDTLQGDAGNDIYRFNLGWGTDVITYRYKNNNEIDAIEFVGIDPNDLIMRKVGSDMVITHRTTGDQVTIQSQFAYYNNDKSINFIRFDHGIEWDLNAFNVQAVKGTELNDVIEGTTEHDVIHAGAGDDVITGTQFYNENPENQYFVYGEAGNDKISGSGYLDGGIGNDEINGRGHLLGGEGDDKLTGEGILEGQAGNDTLTGQGQLYGGGGQDQLTLNAIGYDKAGLLSGGTGDDILTVSANRRQYVNESNKSEFIQNEDGYFAIQQADTTEAQRAVYIDGGKGNDIINGSFGDEIYLFNLGDGQDTIIERPANQNFSNVAASFDILRFGSEIAVTEISLHRYGTDLVVQHSNGTDQVTIKNYFTGGHFKINEIQFADQTVWDSQYIENHVTYHGTANADEFWGYRSTNEIFELGEGNDKVYANGGDDTLYGQAGNDTLLGQDGNDSLYGGEGDDYLDGGNGDDFVYGGVGNDVVAGGKGIDILDGGAGDDKYYWYLADGKDVIDQTGGGTDVLWIMDSGVTRDRISFKQEGNDLIVTVDNNAEQSVRVKDHFLGGEKAIATVQANNQVGISATEIAGIIKAQSYNGLYDIVKEGTAADETIYGTSGKDLIQSFDGNDKIWAGDGNDQLEGGAGDDYLDGQAGDDRLYGGAGNDTLLGGKGIDIMDGGAGNDKYYWYLADGKDVIDQTGGGTDVLWIMDTGVTANRIQFSKEGNDLIVMVDNNAEQSVRVKDHFLGGDKAIASVQANGQVGISAAQIAQKVLGETTPTEPSINTVTGTANADTLYGTAKDDLIQALDGDDQVWAQDGNDRIEGGAGNDYLAGQGGNDQIYGGFGNDTLVGGLGVDTLDGGAGDDKYYWYLADGKDVIDQTGGGTDVLWIMDNGVTADRIQFSKEGNDLIVMVDNNVEQSVRVKDHFLGGEKAIAKVQANGQVGITAEQIAQKVNVNGNTNTDPAGDTTYNYISGALTITEVSGTDKVVFASGITMSQISSNLTKSSNDLLIKVNGSATNVVTVKNFFLAGNYLVETFQTATGEQLSANQIFTAFGLTMPGTDGTTNAAGDTTYNYTSGDLTITEVSGTDKVVFASGITFSQVGNNLTKSGNDLIIKVNGSATNKVTVKDFFLAGDNLVETFQLATGEQLTASQIFTAFGLTLPTTGGGTINAAGDTTYNYTSGDLTITEVSGTDKVVFASGITFSQVGNNLTKSGNDLIIKVNGSATNKVTVKDFFLAGDKLVESFQLATGEQLTASQIFGAFGLTLPSTGGGTTNTNALGDTTYNYTTGDLTITEVSGTDKVIFKNGITFNQIGQYLNKSGNDLILKLDGSNTNKVTVKDFFLGGAKVVETFEFETGGSLTAGQIFGAFGITMPTTAATSSRMAVPMSLTSEDANDVVAENNSNQSEESKLASDEQAADELLSLFNVQNTANNGNIIDTLPAAPTQTTQSNQVEYSISGSVHNQSSIGKLSNFLIGSKSSAFDLSKLISEIEKSSDFDKALANKSINDIDQELPLAKDMNTLIHSNWDVLIHTKSINHHLEEILNKQDALY